MKVENIEDIYKLSPTQQGLLFHTLYAPDSGIYCDQYRIAFKGNLNPLAFEQAWQQVAKRHSVLRTSFFWEEVEEPMQVVYGQVALPLEKYDWRGINSVEQEQKLEAFLTADRSRGYQLSEAPLMRLVLIRMADEVYQFIWSNHHILFDGWSRFVLFNEVLEIYQALNNGNQINLKPAFPYRKYIAWLRQQNLSEAEAFWQRSLQGVTAPTPLVVDKLISNISNIEEYSEQQIELSLANTEKLKSVARQYQLTLNTLVQGAWALLLSRYSGEDDVIFGANTSGRPVNLTGVESGVGLFVNSLPVRVQVNEDDFLILWLKKLQAQQAEARLYEYSPLVQVQGWSELPKGVPLFHSLIAFENYPVDAALRKRNKSLEIADFSVVNRTNYPLSVIVIPDEKLLLKIICDRRYFDDATITRMLGHLQTLLEGMAANPEQQLKDIPLLTQTEQHLCLVKWNNTQKEYPLHLCLHQLIEAQVEKAPNAVAVVFADQKLTYQELNNRANQLAQYLQKLGVKPEVQVGICVERSLEMVVGLLGILKAGGAYVPIDPEYPQQRQAFMLQDCQTTVLLTQQKFPASLPEHQAQVICLDTDWKIIAQEANNNLVTNIASDNLAYVIYTSGSTGQPKGAMNTHAGVCNRLLWMQNTYQLTANDRVLQKTPFSFDVSVWEFFWPLLAGACLVVAQPGGHRDSNYLVQLIAREQITTLHFVPSMLRLFLQEQELDQCDSLKRVFSSGEALPFDLQQSFFERLQAQLYNLYGPTEAAIDVTAWICQRHSREAIVPIGSPIANTQIYILDAQLRLVPVGVPGEMYIGGVGLARGYFNHPELTAEKFIPHQFSDRPDAKLYKTGDLARYQPDGTIEFLGRIDYQIKLRGLRIELGEIEAVLSQHPAVQQNVVVAREDEVKNQRLVAYVVPNSQTDSLNSLLLTVNNDQVSQWKTVFDKTYNQTSEELESIFNFLGWNSSYTNQPIPINQMREWLEQTVERILHWEPKRVLEIGCGTGLLLFQIAPHTEQYYGTDLASTGLDYISQHLQLPQVKLEQRTADNFEGIEAGSFNAIVLNSVVQYFPNIDYLLRVIAGAVETLAPGGFIFLGDVRNLLLLEAFHTSVQLYQSPASLSVTELKHRVQNRIDQEQELLIEPAFFIALQQHLPQISHVQIQIKRGQNCNEMTKFRYDVTLYIHADEAKLERGIQAIYWLDWQQAELTIDDIRQLLVTSKPKILGLRNVPNARVIGDIQVLELLTQEFNNVGELQAILDKNPHIGINPEEFWSLGEELAYIINIQWSNFSIDGSYDVVLVNRRAESPTIIPVSPEKSIVLKSWDAYANNPLQRKLATNLVPQLRRYLEEKLPDYMVPAAFLVLKDLPLTFNGKVDRKELPEPGTVRPDLPETFMAPRTAIETNLAEIWLQVLGLEQVGIHDNFFELGGDSILSIQVIAKAKQANIQLTPKQLFDYPTIAELAVVVNTTPTQQIEPGAVTGAVLLTPIQHWFFAQELLDSHHWNQAVLLKLRQKLEPTLLAKAVQQLLIHHDALRLRFEDTASGWQQVNAAPDEVVPFFYTDLSAIPASEQLLAMEKAATQLQASLNLDKGPILRVALFDCGAQQPSRLLFIIHHLAVDGVSWQILLTDLQTAYQQLSRDELISLPAKTTSFQNWAYRLQEYVQSSELKQQMNYWLTALQQPVSPLPVDYADGNNTADSACTTTISLTVEETQALLQQVPKVYKTQINDVLLTALVQAFGEWTGEYSLLLDLEGHGREMLFADVDLSRTVGWFTSLFPVRLDLGASLEPGGALKTVKEQLRQILNNGIGYGVMRYLSTEPEIQAQFAALPQAEVLFNYLGQLDATLTELSIFELVLDAVSNTRSLRDKRSHLLIMNGFVSQGKLKLSWAYSTAVHQPSTVENLAQTFLSALRSLIAHCQLPTAGGYTPADFLLVKLNQATLDQLIGSDYHRIEDIYPLSPIQQGLLFHTLYVPESQMYFEQWSCSLHGNLNLAALQQAWQQVIQRHPVLRTVFNWQSLDEPVQIVRRQVELPWQQYDWRKLSLSEQTQQLEKFLESDRHIGFNLAAAPVMRLTLIQVTDNTHYFIWSHHHILMDGWAAALLLKEVFELYQAINHAEKINLQPARTYRNYIAWLQKQDMHPAEAFWRGMLQGFTTPTPVLPKYQTSNPDGSYKLQEIRLSTTTSNALQTLARRHQITLNTLIQGTWALLLSHYSGELDVVFGSTVSGRPTTLEGAESIVGLFINTLPVRVQLKADELFFSCLQQVQNQQVQVRQYEHSSLVKIHKWSDIPQNLPLFESIVVFQNYPLSPSLRQGFTDVTLGNVRVAVSRNNYPLTLRVRIETEWLLQILYSGDRFEAKTITKLFKHLEILLQKIIEQPTTKLSKLLAILDADEKQQQQQKEQELATSSLQKLKFAKRKVISG
ncbi:non-ribosomal peptide synthetase [uncultured Nostoc sp.]|uniref:non-ribosomal peptide synthetase n=1 Tax=uncultured Nostoc sp. TaxID=340711 RepID=UPI00260C4D10|nr:non-ribosomal peptide synthetase [uncultured Nostoc sp.]